MFKEEKNLSNKQQKQGFTLLEVLISVTILVVVISVAGTFMTSNIEMYNVAMNQATLGHDGEMIMSSMLEELQKTGRGDGVNSGLRYAVSPSQATITFNPRKPYSTGMIAPEYDTATTLQYTWLKNKEEISFTSAGVTSLVGIKVSGFSFSTQANPIKYILMFTVTQKTSPTESQNEVFREEFYLYP